MYFKGPSTPSDSTLAKYAPLPVWQVAKAQARRSPMLKFRVGACVWDPSSREIIGKGCSHPDIAYSRLYTSMHAEHHALRNCNHLDVRGLWVLIYTLNRRGGCSGSSRPCYSCARSLLRAGITGAIFPEMSRTGWTIREEYIEELFARAPSPEGPYARQQRIPA